MQKRDSRGLICAYRKWSASSWEPWSILDAVLRVTVDTNILSRDMQRLAGAAEGLEVQVAPTTVTLRERGASAPPDEGVVRETLVWNESQWGASVWGPSAPVMETLVLGESRLGMAALGSDEAQTRFEAILAVISDGSFPKRGDRETLTTGARRQLRDAMILEAHTRDRRDVLVSEDRKAFIGRDGAKRQKLEALCQTKIRTVDEFCREVEILVRRD